LGNSAFAFGAGLGKGWPRRTGYGHLG